MLLQLNAKHFFLLNDDSLWFHALDSRVLIGAQFKRDLKSFPEIKKTRASWDCYTTVERDPLLRKQKPGQTA